MKNSGQINVQVEKNKIQALLNQALEEYNQGKANDVDDRLLVHRYLTFLNQNNSQIRTGNPQINNQKFENNCINSLFQNIIWRFDMTKTFIQQVQKLSQHELILVLILMRGALNGRINSLVSVIPFSITKLKVLNFQHAYCFGYEYRLLDYVSPQIAFSVIPKKYPVMNGNNNPNQFKFFHEIEFIAIMTANKMKNFNYQQEQTNYFNQLQNLDFQKDLIQLQEIKKNSKKYVKIGQNTDQDVIGPLVFKPLVCKTKQFFEKKLDRWLDELEYEQYQKRMERMSEISQYQYLRKKYSQMPSSQQLLTIISKLPNQKIKPTSEQLDTIIQDGDVIVIGRSGTGKTTCALLKLFSTDILFRLRMKLDQIKYSNSEIQLDQVENSLILKTVFVTASPLLACQIKRLYDKLVSSLQGVINAKRKKIREQESEANQQEQVIKQEGFERSTFQIIEALKEAEESAENKKDEEDINDIEDDEVDNYEKEMGSFSNFDEISKYPVFLTLRKLIMLIDSSLLRSFFKFFKQSHNRMYQWHNEQLGVLSLDENKPQSYFNEKVQQQKIQQIDDREDIFIATLEVTQEVFLSFFWPQIKTKMNQRGVCINHLDPSLVWGEICTKIKGHETSYTYFNQQMSLETYQCYHSNLSKEDARILYSCFKIYEELKEKFGYFDILDIVNHINKEIECGQGILENFQYLFLDEIQDVPKAVLIMLDNLTELGLFCYGDNAQNIAKGVGYNFYEIKNLLQNQYAKNYIRLRKKVNLYDLNINFRSHNQILQLANSVIKIIEVLFPEKMDRLKKETSSLIGPKPAVILSENPFDLLQYISEFFQNENKVVEFGCNQVILVKDQESKLKLPEELQNTLVLTIYEAKGLEFDDVILYNFFTDCTTTQQKWKILNSNELNILFTKDYFAKYPKSDNPYLKQQSDFVERNEKAIIQDFLEKNSESLAQFNSLCQDLKQLYVAITRPKRKLIIFDDNVQKRQDIQKIWQRFELVDIIETQQKISTENKIVIVQQQGYKDNWKKLGYRMFRLGNYESAFKCFEFANENLMVKKCKAYYLAAKASMIQQNQTYFQEAAILFEEIDLPQRAGQCYFSAQCYQKAFVNYQKAGLKTQAAESAYFSKDYEQAGEIFAEIGEARRAIECYHKLSNWEKIITVMNQYREQFQSEEKLAFLNQYFPKFLLKMQDEIELQDIEVEEDEGQAQFQDSQSFCIENSLDQGQEQEQQEENIIEVEDSQSFQVEDEDSFACLSNNDKEVKDEWVKLDQNSLIDQKSLIKSMISSSEQSQFSNLLLLNSSSSMSIINSRKNIYIKNKVLQQLIVKFEFFSEDFKNHLETKKNKKLMLSNRGEQEKEFDHMINFLYDLENIDIDTIYLLLDLLEQFKSYKLCIYICNQFKLGSHLGRYLVSLAFQYSPLSKNASINLHSITNSLLRRRFLNQSLVAQMALQRIMESINPQFLQFKNEEELNSFNCLGLNYYQELIQLGFWKSIIYQLNFKTSLDLCKSFGSYSEVTALYEKNRQYRLNSLLSEAEQFELQKNQYFECVDLNLKQSKKQFSDLFKHSEMYFQIQGFNPTEEFMKQIFKNIQNLKQNLPLQEKLLQIESLVLCPLILNNYTQECSFTQEQFLQLLEIQIQIHNGAFSFSKQSEIYKEILSLIYQISFPRGKIMEHYSSFVFVKITSNLCQYLGKSNSQQQLSQEIIGFIDIEFENIVYKFDYIIDCIKKHMEKMFKRTIEINSNKMKPHFVDIQVRPQFQNALISSILPRLILKSAIFQKQKRIFQTMYEFSQINHQQLNSRNLQNNNNNSIFNCVQVNKCLAQINEILLQSNCRSEKLNFIQESYVVQESCSLFNQAKQMIESNEDPYAFIILAINLLNYCNKLPLAMFSINALTIKNRDAFLKYMEFLECQNSNIVEDSIGCYVEFNQQVEKSSFLNEELYHCIRIGMSLLISSLDSNSYIIFPLKFKTFIKNGQQKLIELNIFPLQSNDSLQEFFYLLQCLMKRCIQRDYDIILGGILVLTFIINLPKIDGEIKKSILQLLKLVLPNNSIQIEKILVPDKSKREQLYFLDAGQLRLQYYNCIMKTRQLKNQATEEQLNEIYNQSIEQWQNIQKNANNIKVNGISLLSKWRKIREKRHKIDHNNKNYFLKIKLSQFYTVKSLLKKDEKQDYLLHEILKFQQLLMKKLMQEMEAINFHYYNSLLDQIASLIEQIVNGKQVQEAVIKSLKDDQKIWDQNNLEQQTKEIEFVKRNKEFLSLKWKQLKSGVKTTGSKLSSQTTEKLQQILEDEEDDN